MAHETKESYYLAILDDYEVIIIDRADTPEIWQIVARLGQRSPFHATASGQVLVADLTPDLVQKIIVEKGLKKFTPHTITSPSKLRERLKKVREEGFAIANAEYKPDLCVIAVPVRDHHGRVAAALMTAFHADRARKDKPLVKGIIAILKREAATISREIGYLDPGEPHLAIAQERK
jgi:IclR family pca regulon transcriptional regulator